MRRHPVAVLTGLACLGLLTACDHSAGDEQAGPQPGAATASSTKPAASATPTDQAPAAGSSPVPSPTETVRFFDTERMNADVRRVMTEDYGVRGVRAVSCPRNEPVEAGASFVCRVELPGGGREVTITVESEQGRYRVGSLT